MNLPIYLWSVYNILSNLYMTTGLVVAETRIQTSGRLEVGWASLELFLPGGTHPNISSAHTIKNYFTVSLMRMMIISMLKVLLTSLCDRFIRLRSDLDFHCLPNYSSLCQTVHLLCLR